MAVPGIDDIGNSLRCSVNVLLSFLPILLPSAQQLNSRRGREEGCQKKALLLNPLVLKTKVVAGNKYMVCNKQIVCYYINMRTLLLYNSNEKTFLSTVLVESNNKRE